MYKKLAGICGLVEIFRYMTKTMRYGTIPKSVRSSGALYSMVQTVQQLGVRQNGPETSRRFFQLILLLARLTEVGSKTTFSNNQE